MKTLIFKISFLLGTLAMFTSCEVGYVSTVPEAQVYVDTSPPYTGAIWIGPEYEWRNHTYVVVPGHWEHPRGGRSWHGGYWEHNERGHRWHRGGWR